MKQIIFDNGPLMAEVRDGQLYLTNKITGACVRVIAEPDEIGFTLYAQPE